MCPVIVPGVGIATITYSNSDRIVGTEAIHTCLEGLVPHFDLMRTCTGDANTAEWNLPEETCRRMFMPGLMSKQMSLKLQSAYSALYVV